jgi:hypothetical protein
VGSRPLGAGRYGQLDLAGSVAEWNDGWQPYLQPSSHMGTVPIQKGCWNRGASFLARYNHNQTYASFREPEWGVRCARPVQ